MDTFATKVVEVIFLLEGERNLFLAYVSELQPDKIQHIPTSFNDTGVIRNVYKVSSIQLHVDM